VQLPGNFLKNRKLESLVENQSSFTMDQAAMYIFETHQSADKVLLQFDQPVLASMIQGKKVMHLRNYESFQFLPGESLILPSNELMCIDFPEAQRETPTQCLALAISEELIERVLDWMNEAMPKSDGLQWGLIDYNFHFVNDAAVFQILQRLLFLFTENHPYKDYFVDNMLRELIVRVLQTNQRKIYNDDTLKLKESSRLSYVVRYIRNHLHEPLDVESLSKVACMSPSHFHRIFKNELGVSPVEFINAERIKLAVSLLQDPNRSIKEVYMCCGFESRSYFNRVFKSKKQLTPKAYQQLLQREMF
jgi:AraC-like DNA-binding protein